MHYSNVNIPHVILTASTQVQCLLQMTGNYDMQKSTVGDNDGLLNLPPEHVNDPTYTLTSPES